MVSFHEIANDNVALQLNRPLIELIFLNLTWVLFLWSRLHVILSFGVFLLSTSFNEAKDYSEHFSLP